MNDFVPPLPPGVDSVPTLPVVSSFTGSHRFLSSFFPAQVHYEDITYPTAEHAYQAAKTLDHGLRLRIAALPTPGEAKRAGRALVLRADWEAVKFGVMLDIQRLKFQDPALVAKLLATGESELVEGNTWGDRVWGVCGGLGQNHLGRLLMRVREELRGEVTAEKISREIGLVERLMSWEEEVEDSSPEPNIQVLHGDCVEVLRGFPDNSFDALVTDPPAGINFMNQPFDSDRGGRRAWVAWLTPIFRECLRVLKPGAYALVWALPRTAHWTATAIEDAGFEIDTVVHHLFGSGMPASKNIARAIDMRRCALAGRHCETSLPDSDKRREGDHLCPRHPDGDPFRDTGTALAGAVEHWILAQRPVEGTYAANALAWGTGGLNVGACGVPRDGRTGFPSNLVLSHAEGCVLVGEKFVASNGTIAPGTAAAAASRRTDTASVYGEDNRERGAWSAFGDGSGRERVDAYECADDCPIAEVERQAGRAVARYFYCPKPTRREKDLGCEDLPSRTGASVVGRAEGSAGIKSGRAGAGRSRRELKNHHVTIKGIALMRYLVRLVARPGQVVVDPFCGSGTTLCAAALEGVRAVGIEREAEYVEIARARVAHWQRVARGNP